MVDDGLQKYRTGERLSVEESIEAVGAVLRLAQANAETNQAYCEGCRSLARHYGYNGPLPDTFEEMLEFFGATGRKDLHVKAKVFFCRWAAENAERVQAKDDTKDDIPKKTKRKRKLRLNVHANNCIRDFKRQQKTDPGTRMTHVVQEYSEKTGESRAYIMRILNDNPEAWKEAE